MLRTRKISDHQFYYQTFISKKLVGGCKSFNTSSAFYRLISVAVEMLVIGNRFEKLNLRQVRLNTHQAVPRSAS